MSSWASSEAFVGKGRVNGRILNRAKIRTANFQLQYLPQFYSYNLKVMLEPFTETLWCECVDADLGVLWIESAEIAFQT